VLDHLFVPSIKKIGFDAIPPSTAGSDVIQAHIIRQLETADLVLCDVSSLNANVFFELGVRTALNLPAAIVRDAYTLQIPFDTSIINHFSYDGTLSPWTLDGEIQRLSDHLLSVINGAKGKNSLWQHFGISTQANAPTGSSTIEDKVDYLIRALDSIRGDQQYVTTTPPSAPEHHEFIKVAAAMARTLNAEFKHQKDNRGRMVLDFGRYIITKDLKRAIIAAGKPYDVEVKVTSEETPVDLRDNDASV
jgi:nucleoside 2-deoxyribosyltransferase